MESENTRPWSVREGLDALNMPWRDFKEKYPDRTKGAWCGKRKRLVDGAERVGGALRQLDTTGVFETLSDEGRLALLNLRPETVASSLHDTMAATMAAGMAAAMASLNPIPGVTLGQPIQQLGDENDPLEGPMPPPPSSSSPSPQRRKPMISWQDFEIEDETDDEALMEALVTYQDQRNKVFATKLLHEVKIEVPDGGPIAVAFPSDWHIGNVGTDHKRIVQDVKLIASHPRLFCSLGGDPIDNFILDKMISASRSQIAQVDVQWRLFRHLVKKLTDSGSLLFVGAGNHDAWTQKVAGLDGISAALRGIQVVNTGEGGFVRLQVGSIPYLIYRKHKPTRWNSSYNPTHFLKQMLRMGATFDFDIGVSEHFHNANIELGEYRPGTGAERAFITTGSYKVRDQYSEDLGYYGGGYGVPVVVLWPDHKEIMPVMRLSQAITILDAFASSQPVA